MPLLTAAQLRELRQIIQDSATALAVTTFGVEVTDEELQRLVDEGYVHPEDLDDLGLTAFTYGQLLAKLPLLADMEYDEFLSYVRKNPVGMSPGEKRTYEVARERAGVYCVGLGNRYSEELGRIVVDADRELADRLREGIASETAESGAARETRGSLVRRLREMSGQMTRDWHRIASTETHQAAQEGLLEEATDRHGEGERFAKRPVPDACDACKAAYLDENGNPKIFTAAELRANGVNNVGRKKAEWLPVYGVMHPWCRCELIRVPRGFAFNEDGQMVPEEMIEKALPVGSVHTWADGRQYKKEAEGKWVPVPGTAPASERTGVIKVDPAVVREKVDQLLKDQAWNRFGILAAMLESRDVLLGTTTAQGKKIGVRVRLLPRPDVDDPRGVSGQHQLMVAADDPSVQRHLIQLYVKQRVGIAGGWERGDLAATMRSVLAHELAHAGDPHISERAKEGRPIGSASAKGRADYYNRPEEIAARMQQIWRELTDRRAVAAIAEMRKEAEGEGSDWKPGAASHLHMSETWNRIADDLTPENRKRILRMAAHAWEAIQTGRVDPQFEKAVYVGPRGGQWSDPEHKVHWRPPTLFGSHRPKKFHPSKLIGTIGGVRIYEVDGSALRQEDTEHRKFTNYGHHWTFSFIPEDEGWLDREQAPGERRYFIDGMLRERRAMKSGASYEDALKAAEGVMRRERSRSVKGREAAELPDDQWLDRIEVRMLGHVDELRVVLADGELIRGRYPSWTEGGNDRADPWVRKDTILIDDDLSPEERPFTIRHEVTEQRLMAQGMPYEAAHLRALIAEEQEGGLELVKSISWKKKDRQLQGRQRFQGFDVAIENKPGSVRHWHDPNTGKHGETKLQIPYGYIQRTRGVDQDAVDVFLGPNEKARKVYVVHQRKAPEFKEYDEDKVMLGFGSAAAAKAAYLAHYSDDRFFGSMTTLPLEEFRQKVYDSEGAMIKQLSFDDLAKGTFGSHAASIVGVESRNTIGGMGHHSPGRTPGENVIAAKPVTDWPPFKKRKKRKKRKDLPRAAERLDVVGLKAPIGFANPPTYEQVQAESAGVDASQAASGHRYRDDLEEQQRSRQRLRRGVRLVVPMHPREKRDV